ncbi:hypothetical protein E3P96_02465 [Wallemia ichthyophaga]|uniref:LOG family protein n=1 Tax=Wallemia ichthyophaga TaxID=245174 RepID=A0A4T0JAR6_WALIC|nr:hypothetical protein E3P96_02465 [Wallemia ichthyophaga]TIB38762.1 hypothetical protein E3P86_01459 [Wallemia ichthyophaga]
MTAICIYSGSSDGSTPIYKDVARQIGSTLATHNISLVYGGGDGGLMGQVARSALSSGGHVTGIIPRAMVAVGEKGERGSTSHTTLPSHPNLDSIVVDSMHERKLAMAHRSSSFIALPGGFGTFEELLEVTTWSQLNIHAKAVIAVNVDGFFNPLKHLIASAVDAGFISSKNAHLIHFLDHPLDGDWGLAAIDACKNYSPTGEEYAFDWSRV